MTAVGEIHWTSTLNDANITNIPTIDTFGTSVLQQFDFGNPLNRVDIVNVATGLSARIATSAALISNTTCSFSAFSR